MRFHLQFSLLATLAIAISTLVAAALMWSQLRYIEAESHQNHQFWLRKSYTMQFRHHSQQTIDILIAQTGAHNLESIHQQVLQPWAAQTPQLLEYTLQSPDAPQVYTYTSPARQTDGENEDSEHNVAAQKTDSSTTRIEIPIQHGQTELGALRATVLLPKLPAARQTSLYPGLFLLLPLLVVILLSGGLITWLAVRLASRPLRQLPKLIGQMAAGTLNIQLEHGRHDEIGDILRALRQMERTTTTRPALEPLARPQIPLAPDGLQTTPMPTERARELRTSLSNVIGMTELLLASELDERQKFFTQCLQQSSEVLYSQLDAWLLGSKENSQIKLGDAFRLRALVEDIAEQQLPAAQHKRLEVVTAISPIVPAVFYGDSAFTHQIITNLLELMIQFSRKGRILVRLNTPETPERPLAGCQLIYFEIETRSEGLSASQYARLYQFLTTQTPCTDTPESENKVLPRHQCEVLIATRRMVESLGGHIALAPFNENAMTIRFTLCLASGQEAYAVPAAPQPPLPTTLLTAEENHITDRHAPVLVAEDNQVNLAITLNMLKLLGYDADVAGNGQEVLAAIQKQRYHLILMDCSMPVMDGLTATQAIRRAEQAQGGHITIIALTANTAPADSEACLAAGMDGYLGKPFKLNQLRAMMERWLPQGSHAATPQ